MRNTAIFLSLIGGSSAALSDLSGVFGENVYARLWRTALSGPPTYDDERGWPHYTQGAHNNTPELGVLTGTYGKESARAWISGFFPDSMWQAYRRRRDLSDGVAFPCEPSPENWLAMAKAWTDPLQTNINLTSTHDLGFMAKPFESAMAVEYSNEYLPVVQNMSVNLAARFHPAAGVIRSWDCNNSSSYSWCSHDDSLLVIIDNMMNLALLARSASNYTHNSTHLDIAREHADKTIQNHVRSDGSSFHVCDYSETNGDLYLCRTAQGLADNSTWARGQAWGIYGFAEFYSLTGEQRYLDTARRMADWFIEHLPADGLPFWDFDAEFVPDVTPRDTSAAAVAASGMILLQEQIDLRSKHSQRHDKPRHDYRAAAEKLLEASVALALAGEVTFANLPPRGAETFVDTPANTTESRGFESILMHGTSNNNPRADDLIYDSGLTYGDFYFVEAGNRLLENRGPC
ncbi:hypothetical protein MBLNU230_g0677t1 [Neophaeotheca triangularis]